MKYSPNYLFYGRQNATDMLQDMRQEVSKSIVERTDHATRWLLHKSRAPDLLAAVHRHTAAVVHDLNGSPAPTSSHVLPV